MNNKALPSLALMVAVAIIFAYVSPTWTGKIASTKAAIQSDKAALAAAKEYTQKQSQLTAERDAIDAKDVKKLETFLPNSVDNVRLILDLDALAARSGLALSHVDVADSANTNSKTGPQAGENDAPAGPVGNIDLTLTAVGTYSSLQTFLKGMEQSGRLLDIRDLTVKGSNTGAYNYQMILRLYWLR